MLKISLLQFPTERRLWQFRKQRAEKGGPEIGDPPVGKVVYRKKCPIPHCITLAYRKGNKEKSVRKVVNGKNSSSRLQDTCKCQNT